MQVMEIYLAPQGEGIFIGEPSIFVRFFGCNFRCVWCDTAYSINIKEWKRANPDSEEDPYSEMSVDDVVAEILTLGGVDTPVVLTGGEPLLQMQFGQLADRLLAFGKRITVETNGSVLPSTLPTLLRYEEQKARMLWSISPKMGSAITTKPDMTIAEAFLMRQEPVQLKFVISNIADAHECRNLLSTWPIEKYEPHIVFQPNGKILKLSRGLKVYVETLQWLQEFVDREMISSNVRVLPQLHAMIHGPEARGV
jgi:7-carboxy-7-deazaguanine synthase